MNDTNLTENRFGCKVRVKKLRNYTLPAGAWKEKELPNSYILPDDRLPVVKNQKYNSCVGFGTTSVMEVLYHKEFGRDKILSPYYVYGNPECRNGYMGEGMFLEDTVNGLRKAGTVPLKDFDYALEAPAIIEAVEERPELREVAAKYRIKSFYEIPKYALVERFINTLKDALYTYEIPIVIASHRYFGGSHCVILIGWNEDDKFIFQNSWGTEYKDGGRWTIPYNHIDEAFVLLDEELELPYEDVDENEWYYKDIKTAYFSDIIKGTSATTFSPNDNILRCEAATIAVRVLNKLQCNIKTFNDTLRQKEESTQLLLNEDVYSISPTTPANVRDLNENEWYYTDVKKMLSTGIMTGDAEGTFRPNDGITRAETAAIIVRLYEYIGKILCILDEQDTVMVEFTDVNKNEWYYKEVNKAANYGFLFGDTEGTFRPNDNITRAEFTSTIVRLMERVDNIFLTFCTEWDYSEWDLPSK